MINLKKLKLLFDKALGVLLSTTILSMVFVAILGVFTRYILKKQASFTTEFLRYALLWVSLLAAAYCFGEKEHIAIDFVKKMFKRKWRFALDVITEISIIFFGSTVLIYGGYQGILMGMNEMSPTLHVPIGYIYAVLPISGIFITFYSIINLMGHFRDSKACN